MAYIEIRASSDVRVIEADRFRIDGDILYVEVINQVFVTNNLQTYNHEIIMAVRNWDYVGYLNPDQVVLSRTKDNIHDNVPKLATVYINNTRDTIVVTPSKHYITKDSMAEQPVWKSMKWTEEQAKEWLLGQSKLADTFDANNRINALFRLHQLYSDMAKYYGWDLNND